MAEFFSVERHIWAWIIGGFFALVSSMISFTHMRLTLKYNGDPILRRHVIRILGMVPVYAIEAWMGLFMKKYTMYWDILRECYEAFVIYSFAQFLLHVLGGPDSLTTILARQGQMYVSHMRPVKWCCRRGWNVPSGEFVFNLRLGILQYVPVKVTMAIVTFVLEAKDIYANGEFRLDVGYPYIVLITNFSQLVAMYCLILFYEMTKTILSPIHPLSKFLCVKLIVFFTFWQAVVIAILVKLSVVQETDTYSTESAAAGLQDFIVCVEMFAFAVAHWYAFPSKEFHTITSENDDDSQVEAGKQELELDDGREEDEDEDEDDDDDEQVSMRQYIGIASTDALSSSSSSSSASSSSSSIPPPLQQRHHHNSDGVDAVELDDHDSADPPSTISSASSIVVPIIANGNGIALSASNKTLKIKNQKKKAKQKSGSNNSSNNDKNKAYKRNSTPMFKLLLHALAPHDIVTDMSDLVRFKARPSPNTHHHMPNTSLSTTSSHSSSSSSSSSSLSSASSSDTTTTISSSSSSSSTSLPLEWPADLDVLPSVLPADLSSSASTANTNYATISIVTPPPSAAAAAATSSSVAAGQVGL